jgi:hypothetical protein
MKFLAVAAVLVTAIASPLFAQTDTQAVSKPLIFAQAQPSPAAKAAVAKRKLKNGKSMTKGKAEHCANPSHDVWENGEFLGCDPDATVRLMMRQEYHEGGGSGGGE